MRTGIRVVMSMLALLTWFPTVRAAFTQVGMMGAGSGGPETGGRAPEVTLQAQAGDTIEFYTQNGRTIRGVPSQAMALPHLVLNRNGRLTDPDERTLLVTVSQLSVPPSGLTLNLLVETQDSDPSRAGSDGSGGANRITVWQASKYVGNRRADTQKVATVSFEVRFDAQAWSGVESTNTPTGYMRYELTVLDAGQTASGPLYAVSQEYAFLLENQWVVPLSEGRDAEGAGPQELVVYYCDMIPFRQGDTGLALARSEVTPYVATELVPAMVEAIRIQTEDWGFPWSEAWTSYRGGRDTKRLSVALSDGETWFHGSAPVGGYSNISIRVSGGENANYDSLTDGVMSTFHHELFHNLQRSMLQEGTGHEDVSGRGDVWEFFSEGTAVLASSVAQPDTQFTQTSSARAYISRACRFVGGSGFAGDLNTSYAKMTPYHAAMYWRYLYEQCGGLEDAGAGMGVVHSALEVLYGNDLVNIASSSHLVDQLPAIMDEALSSPAAALCPFHTYAGSLAGFSRAVYGLRLDGGRCTAPGTPDGCGFYDPNELYNAPPVSKLTYAGQELMFGAEEQPYPSGIRSSYGMDFVEVVLNDKADGQTLTFEFYGDPGSQAEFSVQVWKLLDDGTGTSWQPRLTAVSPAETLIQQADGRLVYTIPEIDTGVFNTLGLIITRLDSGENVDLAGAYTVVLHPGL